jgi:hypothetical protein
MEDCIDVFRSYIHTLGERLKIADLEVDENNDCYLSFDSKYFVKCSVNTEKERISFLAYVGALPEDKEIYYRGILESCYFWQDTAGANVSLDPTDGTLMLIQYCDMNLMDVDLFYDVLEQFVNAVEHWDTKRLEEWLAMTEETTAETANAPSDGGEGGPNMMMFGA